MLTAIGRIEALFRYPVKSMAGEALEQADLGWHGLAGDRRYALRSLGERRGMPWLTATKLPELLRFHPVRRGAAVEPTHVRTPEGEELELFGEPLAGEIASRFGAPVEMMALAHGIFDEATVSVISVETMQEVSRLGGADLDVRRFRPNVVVRLEPIDPAAPPGFREDRWVGGVLLFGDGDAAPRVSVTLRDERCSMINFDPDTAVGTPTLLKAVVRANGTNAGVYGTVVRTGKLEVGQVVRIAT